ncbi:hypothetical protein PsYK624_097500 [Phanerochaete sordida]|uniref:Uncharacterized protein n=1 Tax=Phanerochaete sordida TaxID=48140 RepID=A0A9P3GEZ2_9APHY|nr:hypothetical protein PsYK624_097500 [Phanerochaete sordida]
MAKQSWVKYEQQKDIANPTKAAAEAKKKLDPDGPPPEYLHYLEHKNGDVVTYAEVEAVRKSMKTQWFAWSRKGSAPTVWGEVDHELLTPFIEDIYAQHKFLSYCEHDWKLHKLAQTDYPAWYRTHGSKQRSCKVEDDVEPRHNSKRQKKRHRSPSSRSKSSKRQRIASSTGSGGDVAHSGPALGLQDELSAPARPAPSLPPQPLRPAVSSSTSLLPRPGGRTSRASSASPGRSPSPDFDLDFSGGGSLSGLLDGDPINDLSGNSANSYGTSSSDVSCGTGSSGDIGGTSDPASSGLASSDNAGGNSTGDISMTPIPATSSIDVSPLHGDKSAPSSEAEPMSSPDPAGTVTSFSSSGEDAAPLVNPVSGAEVLSMDVSAGSADKLQDEAPIENDVRNKPKPRLRIVNPITSANLDAQRKATTLAATDVQPPATDSTPTAVPEHARNTSPGPGQEEPSARESEPAASKTNATSSRKFRPGPKDTARNLYGRDYMKKHKDTTTAEFKTIWDELDETTKEAWAQKAKQLQDAKKSAASSA